MQLPEANSSALCIPDRYPLLFTCGPLQTSTTVKRAMVVDYSARDQQFVDCIKEIRSSMLRIAHVDNAAWACVPMQGPGTMGLEASANTVHKSAAGTKKYLLLNTGKYAERQGDMVKRLGFDYFVYDVPEDQPIDLVKFEAFLQQRGKEFSTVGYVHHETSTGMLNPVVDMYRLVKKYTDDATVLMDAISSFGGVDIDVSQACDVTIASSNKCFHSVPGFSCCLIRRSLVASCKGNSRSFTLDLVRQCNTLDKSGQFPFTPPVPIMLAFRQAIREFDQAGGLPARQRRYRLNSQILRGGMRRLGFRLLLDDTLPSFGNMLVSFMMPKEHPNWNFKKFYNGLKDRGFVIYPGKASRAEAFRYACFGDLYPDDCVRIVGATAAVLKEMGVTLAAPAAKL